MLSVSNAVATGLAKSVVDGETEAVEAEADSKVEALFAVVAAAGVVDTDENDDDSGAACAPESLLLLAADTCACAGSSLLV